MAQKADLKQKPQDPQFSYFSPMTEYLTLNALYAYKEPDFVKRSELFSHIIATESSSMLCFCLGRMDLTKPSYEIFHKACLEASLAFKDALKAKSKHDTITKEIQALYDKARDEPGPIGKKYLKEALKVMGISLQDNEINDILSSLAFNDLILLASNAVKIDYNYGMEIANRNPEEIRHSLYKTVPLTHNLSSNLIPTMHLNNEGETIALPSAKLKFLEIAMRLETAVWKAGQIHKAIWENSTDRVNPEKRFHVFDIDDQTRLAQYYYFSKEFSPEDALIRVAFDFYKTLQSYFLNP